MSEEVKIEDLKDIKIPFRLISRGIPLYSREEWAANAKANAGLPEVEKTMTPRGRKLAIIGGGPSVAEHAEELRAWDGDIWSVNRTSNWLVPNGIRSVLYAVDACPDPNYWPNPENVDGAIMAVMCAPNIVAMYRPIQLFDVHLSADMQYIGGSTAVTSSMTLVAAMGYRDVHYFGCEGSFGFTDHIDRDDAPAKQLIVRAGGVDYRTDPQMYLQCQEMEWLFRKFPHHYKNRSGGLLEAMSVHRNWEVVVVNAAFREQLEKENARDGMFDGQYVQQKGDDRASA